ncbi:MAG: 3'-5' exonuclease, partial [Candidatus Hodarchaeota archaeon]
MSKSDRYTVYNTGYRDWFESFLYKQRKDISIFILDYETHSLWGETYDSYDEFEKQDEYYRSNIINGIQIYFLDEKLKKRKAFLRHSPYFFLLLDEGLSRSEINRIMSQVREIGEKQVIDVKTNHYYDAANLTFLKKRLFIKVIADRPKSVPNLRSKCETINGVVEWREADVLFHHRCAIDNNIRIGTWYQARIRGNEIIKIEPIPNKAPPNLKILAYDIETDFEQTREPNPNRDEISMISMFTGKENTLLINSAVVNTANVRDFNILLQPNDKDHSKPWVDWIFSAVSNDFSSALEHYFVKVIVVETEEELLKRFYKTIKKYKPDVLADFFGSRFDLPFIALRSDKYNISLERETGFRIVFKNQGQKKRVERKDLHKNYTPANLDYVEGAGIIHLDAWLFNEKYSYLPKKDLALKPSVEKKLKIIPIGREALFAINEEPEEAVAYSGCDGYITWKYVKEIVLEFFLSMGQMFPVPASELLSRRAGSLDDLLIDAEDHKHGIVGKKKIKTPDISSFSNKISIDSLAYTGGLVEARRSGIFRSDIYYDYKPNKIALNGLKETIRTVIKKESNSLTRKIIKEEFEKRLIKTLEGIKLEYSGDPVTFLKNLETELLKNGVPRQEFEETMENIRRILEESSHIHTEGVEEVTEDILSRIDELLALEEKTQLRGVHVDVTSMYPSQIRQYKLQPSGIVPLTMCRTCNLYEADNSCFFEGDWVIKLSARRPCRFKKKENGKCDQLICTSNDEKKCKKYEPIVNGINNSQEIFTFNTKETEAYILKNNEKLEKVQLEQTYLGTSTEQDPFISLQRWLRNSVDATQLSTKLD